MPLQLNTTRLQLRPIAITDKKAVFAYRSDKIRNQYQGWIPENIDDVEAFISKTAATINTPNSWFQLVIIEQASNEIIGDVGLHFFGDENQQVEIGCTLNKDVQGNGYATEALHSVIEYLFHQLKKHRIIASIAPGNTASIKLVERLGFRKEAHFIQSICIDGQWLDDVVYAVLQSEWE